MPVIVEILILALAVIAFAPRTPLAKDLRYWLVERPSEALGKLTVMNVIVGLIVAVCLIALVAAPEIFTIIGIADLSASLSAYFDAAIIVSLMSAAARLKFTPSDEKQFGRTIPTRVSALFGRNWVCNRRPRARRPKVRLSSDDSEPEGNWAFASWHPA